MAQLTTYLAADVMRALDDYVAELNQSQPGANASRSSVTAAALRAFLLSVRLENKTDCIVSDKPVSSRRSPSS